MARLAGKWTLRCTELEAGWRQRVLVAGSHQHDGGHEMQIGTLVEHVEGEEVTLTLQHFNPGVNQWFDSLEETKYAFDLAVGLTLTLFADDNPPDGDLDFNDLVVLCLPEDEDLASPHAGTPPLDLTIPEGLVNFRR